MKISLICFTGRGFGILKKLTMYYEELGHMPRPFVLGRYALQAAARDFEITFSPVKEGGLSQWAGGEFQEADALVFIGACGIAVRAVAPYVRDKRTDPAVLSVDEGGKFVIPLLSGHLGGANELAVLTAGCLEGTAVVTTATDIQGKFAVDVFAKEHGLLIDDMKMAKAISADILAGEPVGVFGDFPLGDRIPEGLKKNAMCRHNIQIAIRKKDSGEDVEKGADLSRRVLKLIPRCVVLGIGCRRGMAHEKISEVLTEALKRAQIDVRAVCAVATIDIKKNEPGLKRLAEELQVPLMVYSAEELLELQGSFTESEFVKSTTGVGNVCERASLAACLEVSAKGRLLFPKYAKNGVTVAGAFFVPKVFGES